MSRQQGEGTEGPTRTEDGRYVVVDGRRWRATDPAVPEHLRRELVDQLMHARRRVAAANRADDERARRRARNAVHDAKVALGERGEPWWEPTAEGRAERRAAAARALRRQRLGARPTADELDRLVGSPT